MHSRACDGRVTRSPGSCCHRCAGRRMGRRHLLAIRRQLTPEASYDPDQDHKVPRLPWPIATPIPHEAWVAGLAHQSLGGSHPLSNPDGRPLLGRFALHALLTVKRGIDTLRNTSSHRKAAGTWGRTVARKGSCLEHQIPLGPMQGLHSILKKPVPVDPFGWPVSARLRISAP
jgi:hypothetical protein